MKTRIKAVVALLMVLILISMIKLVVSSVSIPRPTEAQETIAQTPEPEQTSTPTENPLSTEYSDLSYKAETDDSPDDECGDGYSSESDSTLFAGLPEAKCNVNDAEIDMLTKTVWGEARGCTRDEWQLVVWTVLQRVDDPRWGDTITEVVTERNQFDGYRASHPVDEEIREAVQEVVYEWTLGAEPLTHEIFAPTVPYYYFDGDGQNNHFREEWK